MKPAAWKDFGSLGLNSKAKQQTLNPRQHTPAGAPWGPENNRRRDYVTRTECAMARGLHKRGALTRDEAIAAIEAIGISNELAVRIIDRPHPPSKFGRSASE